VSTAVGGRSGGRTTYGARFRAEALDADDDADDADDADVDCGALEDAGAPEAIVNAPLR
jgi:hypothetical protein